MRKLNVKRQMANGKQHGAGVPGTSTITSMSTSTGMSTSTKNEYGYVNGYEN